MRDFNERDSLIRAASEASKQPATSKNGDIIISVDENQLKTSLLGSDTSSWTKLVMEFYPPGSGFGTRQWTCTYCNVLQAPRAKHCHDCDKCVLQFDHHCVWLGTCIGLSNHCRFWWYICEETALCLWTGILYISYLKSNRTKSCCLTVHVQGRELSSGAILHGCMHLVDLAGRKGRKIRGGQAKTRMFVHIAPDLEVVAKTLSTLKFAERASSVELGAAQVNKDNGDVKELKNQDVVVPYS